MIKVSTYSANEILDLVYSIVGKSFTSLKKRFPDNEKSGSISEQRIYKFQSETATITCIPNIFDIFDICLVEFNNIQDSSEFYESCNAKFKNVDTHVWFDDETLIQFYTNQVGTRSFRFCLKPLCDKEEASA
ncbi:MAG: hypothetical protein E6772_02215 [Dysgonomonas sp.]|nr:hypothetical protein [Dysgonomonas sp.]